MFGNVCEGMYTPNEDSFGVTDMWDNFVDEFWNGKKGKCKLRDQIDRKSAELVGALDDATGGVMDDVADYLKKHHSGARGANPTSTKTRDARPVEPKPTPYKGEDASAWFDPEKLRSAGRATYDFCYESCVKAAPLAYSNIETKCQASCAQYK